MKKYFNPFLSMSLASKIAYSVLAVVFTVYIFSGYGSAEGYVMGATATLLRQYFTTEIQPLLFPESDFLSRAIIDDAYAGFDTVQLATSGTIPNVSVNRQILPAAISQRSDVPTSYVLQELTTDPTLLGTSEELVTAYNKRASILDQHAKTINAKACNLALNIWGTGANASHTLAMTGPLTRAAGNTNGSQTGNRRSLTVADITNVQRIFFQDNVQNTLGAVNGIAVITPAQYQDLMQIPQFSQYLQYGSAIVPEGVMRRAFGFDFYVRSSVNVLATGGTTGANIKGDGAAGAATDQDCAIFYHPNFVRRAVGQVIPFINENRADFYGTIFSMLVRFGAIQARSDAKGVVNLYEANS